MIKLTRCYLCKNYISPTGDKDLTPRCSFYENGIPIDIFSKGINESYDGRECFVEDKEKIDFFRIEIKEQK